MGIEPYKKKSVKIGSPNFVFFLFFTEKCATILPFEVDQTHIKAIIDPDQFKKSIQYGQIKANGQMGG